MVKRVRGTDFEYTRKNLVWYATSGLGRIVCAGFQALEKLHDTIEASYYGQGCIGHDRCCVTGSKLHRIFREAGPLRAFWMNLFARSETEYLITHFDAIRSSVYAELFCSGLICEFWYWYSPILSEDKFSIPAITLSFDHLFHQGPMGQIVVAARPSQAHRG